MPLAVLYMTGGFLMKRKLRRLMQRLVVSWFILFFQAHVVSQIANFQGVSETSLPRQILRGSSRVPAPHVYVGGYSGSKRELELGKRELGACSHVLGTSRLCRPPPWFQKINFHVLLTSLSLKPFNKKHLPSSQQLSWKTNFFVHQNQRERKKYAR